MEELLSLNTNHLLWLKFMEWADKEGVNLMDTEDYQPWWNVWTYAIVTWESLKEETDDAY